MKAETSNFASSLRAHLKETLLFYVQLALIGSLVGLVASIILISWPNSGHIVSLGVFLAALAAALYTSAPKPLEKVWILMRDILKFMWDVRMADERLSTVRRIETQLAKHLVELKVLSFRTEAIQQLALPEIKTFLDQGGEIWRTLSEIDHSVTALPREGGVSPLTVERTNVLLSQVRVQLNTQTTELEALRLKLSDVYDMLSQSVVLPELKTRIEETLGNIKELTASTQKTANQDDRSYSIDVEADVGSPYTVKESTELFLDIDD